MGAQMAHLEATVSHHEELQKDVECVVESATHGQRMQEALKQDQAKPFQKSLLRLYLCIFVGYLCSATNGFDSNTFGEYVPWWKRLLTDASYRGSVSHDLLY